MDFDIKRIYDSIEETDGKRILVDRLWPRGISKETAKLDLWLKEIAPSHELRKWFNHDIEKFDEFRSKYVAELSEDGQKTEAFQQLLQIVQEEYVTLLYSAKNTELNQAVVLKDLLIEAASIKVK